ncbi:MAG: hypothetical protein ACI81R_003511, partial [Bradymonadia bacterium]
MTQRRLKEVLAILAMILVVITAAELGFRALVPHLSKNSRTLALAPERALRIAEAPPETTTVLILGNSVSDDGIIPDQLQTQLSGDGFDVLVEHQPADTSAMVDWSYQLENHFLATGASPDLLVLPVGNPYPLTRINPQTEDLLFSFLRFSDLPEYVRLAEIEGFEERMTTYLGKLSSLYAFRGRLQKRALSTAFSGFPDLRLVMRAAQAPREAAVTPVWAERLQRLSDENGVTVIVVAMPTEPLDARLTHDDHVLCSRLGW